MDPKFWGPGLWKAIHSMAATANTRETRMHFKNMMTHMAYILPCDVCRNHLSQNMNKIPIEKYMKSSESLFLWTFLLHDAVNDSQGKKGSDRPSFHEIYNTYFRKNPSKNDEVDYDIQDGICQDVCSGEQVVANENTTAIPQKYNTNKTINKTTNKTIYRTTYKPRFTRRR